MNLPKEWTTGQRIKWIRRERGLTQIQLAKKCKISEQGVYAIEKGIREPRWTTVIAISAVLKVNLETLVPCYNDRRIDAVDVADIPIEGKPCRKPSE